MGFEINKEVSKVEPSLNKTLRLKESLINKLQEVANKNDISFNYLVSQMLQYCLDNLENNK
jgi:predicted HicB family RNase H-like nuclease